MIQSARPEYFRGVTYVGSYPDLETCPSAGENCLIAFTGRSNSGKSSLLSALCDHKNLARSSSTAGKTRSLNYYHVPPLSEGVPGLYLVDMPGFGYARISDNERKRLRQLADNFLLKAENLALIVIVLDARRKLENEERNIMKYCADVGLPAIMARAKWDKLNAVEKKAARALWKKEGVAASCVPVSSPKKIGLDAILSEIRKCIQ